MALRLQMKEKEVKKTIIKQNDLSYANQIASRVTTIADQEKQAELMRLKVKIDYSNSLNKQIKTDKQRKKYGDLMTEHERRVHDKTIKAYE